MVAYGFVFPFAIVFIECDKIVEANFYDTPFFLIPFALICGA